MSLEEFILALARIDDTELSAEDAAAKLREVIEEARHLSFVHELTL